jgi:hypothetical protein
MSNIASIKLLRQLTVHDIERDGPTASVMVRSGLLLEIIDLALASAGEAGTAKTEGLGPKDEHAAPEGGDAQ